MWTFVGSQVFWGRSQKHAQPHEEILHFTFPWLNSWAGRRLGTKAVPHPGAPCWDFSQGAAKRAADGSPRHPTAAASSAAARSRFLMDCHLLSLWLDTVHHNFS